MKQNYLGESMIICLVDLLLFVEEIIVIAPFNGPVVEMMCFWIALHFPESKNGSAYKVGEFDDSKNH